MYEIDKTSKNMTNSGNNFAETKLNYFTRKFKLTNNNNYKLIINNLRINCENLQQI